MIIKNETSYFIIFFFCCILSSGYLSLGVVKKANSPYKDFYKELDKIVCFYDTIIVQLEWKEGGGGFETKI